MSDIHERLIRIYGTKSEEISSQSWIPKRSHRKGDVMAELADKTPTTSDLSPRRTEDIIEREAFLVQGKEMIKEKVSSFLMEQYGESGQDWRMSNFEESWNRFWEKYGEDLVEALVQEIETFDERPFVNFAGYIDKEILKEAVKSLTATRGCR